jgi:hypothetical protein
MFKLIFEHDEWEIKCVKCTESWRMVGAGHFGNWFRPGVADDEL